MGLAAKPVQISKHVFSPQLQTNAEDVMGNPDTLDPRDGRILRHHTAPSGSISLNTLAHCTTLSQCELE